MSGAGRAGTEARRRSFRACSFAAAGAAAALLPTLALFGFTVDDALIPARYAANIARGSGYRFNAGGPSTDGVTPFGFPYLLAPFARGGPEAALFAAKLIGALAWVLAGAALGVAIGRAPGSRLRFAALALVAASAPLGAWASAGLETGLVTALATFGVVARASGRDRAGALLVGLAAALRPELVVWAAAVATPAFEAAGARAEASSRVAEGAAARALLARGALALAPFTLVALARAWAFGRAFPLSAAAKPPDVALGFRYALACALLTGPLALLAPRALARAGRLPRVLAAATLAHLVAVGVAGGDWMPLSRLVVPVLPAVALAAAHLAGVSSPPFALGRIALVVAAELWVAARVGPSAARVGAERRALVRELAPALGEARVVAALDVGWVGAATDAEIVDLAGVTDPAIAALGGGHTSKRIPASLLDARGVDTLVLLLAPGAKLEAPFAASRFARVVEARVARIPWVSEQFRPVSVSTGANRYVVLRREPPRR